MAHKEDDESLDEIQPSMSLALSEEGFDRIKSDVFRRLLNLELQNCSVLSFHFFFFCRSNKMK